ncbi:MAG: alpha-amylase [Treponema sp.]|nr:alpha-amylase [Treponema sp.]
MAGKVNLILGSHAHVFPSATDEEFEVLYQTRLRPFITVLNQYPKIPAVLHYSGFLFSRLEQKKPELFLLIKHMAARKQLELLGGGFYEPIMPLLPPADRIGQIEMLTTYIRQNFGRKPQGCMLAYSLWEQSLAGMLAACGMDYTFLSEEQFAAAGCKGKNLYGPVCTEDQGKLLVVFPVFSSLAGIGKDGIRDILQKVKITPDDGKEAVITVFPDFPQEDAEESILSFFEGLVTALADKSGNVNLGLTTPGRIYRSSTFLPRLYFPASGDSSCSQPRSFLARYPEANELYARIHFIHNLINQLRGDKSRKRSAREELWKAQGAETLSFIGNKDVRRYAQKAILASERIIREKEFKSSLLSFDFDLDRMEEFLFHDKNLNCYVRTKGAAIFELDYLPKGWNYLDSFTGDSADSANRKKVNVTNDSSHGSPPVYSAERTKMSEGSPPDRRCAFIDMLFPGDFIPPAESSSSVYTFPGDTVFPENSRFCGNEEFKLLSADRAKLKASFVLSPRKGIPFGFIEIQKTYSLEKNTLNLCYKLSNMGEEKTVLCFVPRFDLALAGGELLFRRSQGEEESSSDKNGIKKRVLSFEEQSSKHGAVINVGFQTPCDLYFADLEESCQTRCFLPVFQLFLNPGDMWENRITVSVSAKVRKN